MTYDYFHYHIGDRTFCVVPINSSTMDTKGMHEQLRLFHNIGCALGNLAGGGEYGSVVLVWQNHSKTGVKQYPSSEVLEGFDIAWSQVLAAKKKQVEIIPPTVGTSSL